MFFSMKFIANAVDCIPLTTTQFETHPGKFSAIVTDSRKIVPNCVFLALKGDHFDGHAFIEAAVDAGASGVIFEEAHIPPNALECRATYFPVQNTLLAYRSLAKAWRQQFQIPIIIIAGSVGKTTTKEILAALLKGKYQHILKTQGSQNGFVGIPMTLLELRNHHEIAVIELGIDAIGAMHEHLDLIEPTAGAVTAIAPEHLENLKDLATVAHEEGLALHYLLQHGGYAAVNMDDPCLSPFSAHPLPKIVRFSLGPKGAQDDLLTGTLLPSSLSLEVNGMGWKHEMFEMPLPGAHNARNFLTACALALGHGMTPAEVRTGLATFKGPPGRSEVRQLPGPTPVLCDFYNASPASMNAGLDVLTQFAQEQSPPRTRWACLGDMLELGLAEEKLHRDLAEKIMALGIENVLLYGPRMRALFEELQKRRFEGKVSHFATHAELASALTRSSHKGDTILIKGSRGMKMEEVWKIFEPIALKQWQ